MSGQGGSVVKRLLLVLVPFLAILAPLTVVMVLSEQATLAQQPPPAVPGVVSAPVIPFDVVPNFLKYPPTMNLGEVLSVAVNSKKQIIVLNHPGSATTGPLYGNATTQLLEFDPSGKFVKEIGQGVYGLGYSHSVRFDKYDNLWVVDKGTNAVVKFNPAGYVTLNLGRRMEGYEGEYHRGTPDKATAVDGLFNGPTDIGWDASDNIFVSDGYVNSRIAKFDKNGKWIKSWGSYGSGGEHANQNPGLLKSTQHAGRQARQRVRSGSRQPPYSSVRQRRQVPAIYVSQRAVRQDTTSGARQHAEGYAGRDGTVGSLYYEHDTAVPVCRGFGAGSFIQVDARRQDSGCARRVRSWRQAIQLGSRSRVPFGE
jgi:hypothetical protein